MTWPAALRVGQSDRGIALLMVLWIFMVLTVLVAEFSRGMRDDAVSTQNIAEETQARGVAMAGINQAIYRTMMARKDGDDEDEALLETTEVWQPDGSWHDGAYSGGRYSVRIIDESAKIPLNRSDETLLRKVFANIGLDLDDQEAVVDAILDWRDPDTMHRLHGVESEYYLSLPEPYPAKDGPFDSVDELLMVRGITPELYYGTRSFLDHSEDMPPLRLKDIFSVFNKTGNINVRHAPEAVIRALIEGEEADVEEVLEAREADRGSALNLLRAKIGDPILARRLVDRAPGIVAIDARAKMEDGQVQARLGAIVYLAEDGDGFHIERWFDRLPVI